MFEYIVPMIVIYYLIGIGLELVLAINMIMDGNGSINDMKNALISVGFSDEEASERINKKFITKVIIISALMSVLYAFVWPYTAYIAFIKPDVHDTNINNDAED